MYQYPNSLEYYNYNNNNYNIPNYTEDVDKSTLYDPYQGFIRGNMFQDLYNSYKITNPINLDATTKQEEMLIYLDALCFAAHDISLYLDINPNDKDMLQAFKNYRNEEQKLLQTYEENYGPIFISSEANTVYPWAWDNSPWPWEKM
jgi:spore coat protein JB